MSDTISPTLAAVYTALGNFIVAATGLPNAAVVRGVDNLVPMPPTDPGFIVMTGLFQIPLATNQDSWDQAPDADPTTISIERDTQFNVQVDCYGATADQWAPMLSTLLRDDYGCTALAPNCQPLYCSDARMMPFEDAEDQYEQRWTFDAVLQYNPVVTPVQTFATSLKSGVIDVNEAYPP
jgi:hypothetical protein